jgi:disulfide bond formation protein DsbB
MHNRQIFHHNAYYFIELLILLFGFGMLFVFGSQLFLELIILGIMLVVYIGMGIMHHKIHHDLHPKIVIEYVLVSILIFASFIFLNISRL